MILIKDKEFIRGNCPMTKEDIRALAIWKMNLSEDSIVLDIGAGSGSITVQSARLANKGIVYAVERKKEAIEVAKNNIKKFNCNNVKLVEGEAIDIINSLISENIRFDSIFIGGSGGDLLSILEQCNKILSKNGALVMNFITLDNAYKAIEKMKELKYVTDISMVTISKNRENSYMMIGNNPIYIIQCVRGEE